MRHILILALALSAFAARAQEVQPEVRWAEAPPALSRVQCIAYDYISSQNCLMRAQYELLYRITRSNPALNALVFADHAELKAAFEEAEFQEQRREAIRIFSQD